MVFLSTPPPPGDEEWEKVINEVVGVLVDAATRVGDVEMRVAGVRALTRGVMTVTEERVDAAKYVPEVVKALGLALDDYAVDSRGDVGSWVRRDGIEAVKEGWRNKVLRFGMSVGGESGDPIEGLVLKLVRLSVEKLDKLRAKAFEVLKVIFDDVQRERGQGNEVKEVRDLGCLLKFPKKKEIDTSAQTLEYFAYVLPVVQARNPAVLRAFWEGYVLSAGGGSDSLLRVAGRALWEFLDGLEDRELIRVIEGLLEVLEARDERIVNAALETVGGGLEMGVLRRVVGQLGKRMFLATQAATRAGAGGMGRVVAGVRVYRALGVTAVGGVRGMVVRKLVGMLAHKWPRVRREVAEALWMVLVVGGEGTGDGEGRAGEAMKVLEEGEWMGKMEVVKGCVERVRGVLGLVYDVRK
ncbi:tubulin folding cofactor D C terminal-domain-containing protein [Kalaharituber pfeilii]|nr:tubulin folding cofactor D C terminal-domain-containing protein [Kalaharituber pfeilii]